MPGDVEPAQGRAPPDGAMGQQQGPSCALGLKPPSPPPRELSRSRSLQEWGQGPEAQAAERPLESGNPWTNSRLPSPPFIGSTMADFVLGHKTTEPQNFSEKRA